MSKPLSIVMAGLVPAIHVLLGRSTKDVDTRVKPAHDNQGALRALIVTYTAWNP